MTNQSSRYLLSEQGPFADAITGFKEREAQMVMADTVANALEQRSVELIEAGTGTGKTYAYLVPALEFDGKTIIATGTRNLQDQLFQKDLPTVIRALGKTRKVALLKGRQNYLCSYRLEMNVESTRFVNREVLEDMLKIREWSRKTKDGDLTQLNSVAEDSMAFAFVTSTAENCLGSECPMFSDCFVAKARKHAMESDIVIINQHLLMADIALKRDGFGELLPRADAYIIDEAHQLPDVATLFFGQALSLRQINELCRDCEQQYRTELTDCSELSEGAAKLEKAAADLRILLGEEAPRQFWREFREQEAVFEAFALVIDNISELTEVLKEQAIRSREAENLYERADDIGYRARLFLDENEQEYVQWIEIYRNSFTLNATPLSIADKFKAAMKGYSEAAWVMTSATLAVNQDFTYFARKLGLKDAQKTVLASPFNYAEQALLYVPRYLANPAAPNYTESFVNAMLPLIAAARGRTFLLFTSHRAMAEAAALLAQYGEYQLLVQGQASKSYLLEHFRNNTMSILLGTYSFWEGVDVAGDALSLVAIDKLPFASPGDPVNQARIESLRRNKRDAFGQFQLPDAIIALKQGAGRLIRDTLDRGVLAIGDPRIVARNYGKQFRSDLPPMIPTRNQTLAEEFLQAL
ncbi:MAG: ATP-dependent DNA helicase [Gammaproteobacteria bacterium]|nr:ATP-dependent DNA helicase [Gammaproteobacteria bacterium]